MLRKDLLRVSRRGEEYQPQFVGREARPLAARVLGVFQGHVGQSRGALEEALSELERGAEDFKLVRGFAALLERDATFESQSPLPPLRVRRTVFSVAERIGVTDESDRETALSEAAAELGSTTEAVASSLYADREVNQECVAFDSRWDPTTLIDQYNLSLAQTALFDATRVSVRSVDPKSVISAVKRLGLMYEIVPPEETPFETVAQDLTTTAPSEETNHTRDNTTAMSRRAILITGPNSLFRSTRRYGSAFARLLRVIAKGASWELIASIDDRGRERWMRLTDQDITVPGVDPVAQPAFDSGVESDFANRFRALDLNWRLVREPEPLATGTRAMIPDFAFEYRYTDFRLFFEIMGFWTPEYVEKKLSQFTDLEDVDLLVAVDESLGVGDELASLGLQVITYDGTVRLKDVVDVLRKYEEKISPPLDEAVPSELVPEADVVDLSELAAEHDVPPEVLTDVAFPEHEHVGGMLVRPEILAEIDAKLEAGMDYARVEPLLAAHELDEHSSVLSHLGYRVEWRGLNRGVLRGKRDQGHR